MVSFKTTPSVANSARIENEELGLEAQRNFASGTYTDANGQQRLMIEFSEDGSMRHMRSILRSYLYAWHG